MRYPIKLLRGRIRLLRQRNNEMRRRTKLLRVRIRMMGHGVPSIRCRASKMRVRPCGVSERPGEAQPGAALVDTSFGRMIIPIAITLPISAAPPTTVIAIQRNGLGEGSCTAMPVIVRYMNA